MGVSEVRCSCGRWVWGPPGSEMPGWGTSGGPVRARHGYCWDCHSELTERDGAPVVTPMVPASALAQRDRALRIAISEAREFADAEEIEHYAQSALWAAAQVGGEGE